MQRRLAAALRAPVRVNLDQVVLADPARLQPVAAQSTARSPDPAADLRAAIPFPDATVLGSEDGPFVVRLGPASGLDLSGARALETALRSKTEFSGAVVIPPLQPLPPLMLTAGDGKTPPALGDAALDLWALQRWAAGAVGVRLCRVGSRPKSEDLQPLLAAAFKPLPVMLETSDRAACSARGFKTPFLFIDAAAPAAVAAPPRSPATTPP
jgi:hypothetical protein